MTNTSGIAAHFLGHGIAQRLAHGHGDHLGAFRHFGLGRRGAAGAWLCAVFRLRSGAWPAAAAVAAGGADSAAFSWLRRRRFGRRAFAVLQRGGVLAVGEDHGDRRIDRDVIGAFRHQNFAERALVDRLHLHGGFVGLDLGDHVAGFDGVAFLLEPLGEVALLHGGRQRGHQDFSGHGLLERRERAKTALNDTCRCKARTDRARRPGWRTRRLR